MASWQEKKPTNNQIEKLQNWAFLHEYNWQAQIMIAIGKTVSKNLYKKDQLKWNTTITCIKKDKFFSPDN